MNSDDTSRYVNAFFEAYRLAFEGFDAPAIADHFAFPAHITADSDVIGLSVIPDKQAWTGQIEQLLAMYRAIDVALARVLDIAVTLLSPRLLQAIVHWALYDRAGRTLYDFQAAYTLARIGDSLRITAISHNEIPRYRQCAEQLRSGGAEA